MEAGTYFLSLGSKITADGDCSHEIRISLFLDRKEDSVLKRKDITLLTKGPCSQGSGLSSSHVQMWELDHKEGRALKNSCFWAVVLEKTLESPVDSKEIKPVNLKINQPWILFGRTDAEAPIRWPSDSKKTWLIEKDPDAGKDWRQKKMVTEDEMVGWHHRFNGYELGKTLGDGEGQESLACCSTWGCKESDTTWWLSNNNRNIKIIHTLHSIPGQLASKSTHINGPSSV